MTEADIETILRRAREAFSAVTPRINLGQWAAIRGPRLQGIREVVCGMTHMRTSLYYPQSSGQVESWHKRSNRECIRPLTPLCLEDARRLVADFVHEYNTLRLHSSIGYVTPQARLEGRDQQILAERRCKLAAAHQAQGMAHSQPRQSQPQHETSSAVS